MVLKSSYHIRKYSNYFENKMDISIEQINNIYVQSFMFCLICLELSITKLPWDKNHSNLLDNSMKKPLFPFSIFPIL